MNSLVGEQLAGEFEILEALGHGASSVVYKVKRLSDNKIYAVKLLHSYLLEKEDSLKRFEQEAKAAMLLSHPNIVHVHAIERTADGQPYLLMDFIEGITLADILKQGRLILPRAWKIFIEIADALSQAHALGVVHRSIKPGNIIICIDSDGSEKAYLSDFGLAKLLPSSGQELQNLTAKGAIIGSPLYMSPEQCMGRDVDTRTDIYSFGCLMYACITGKPPLKGETLMETLQKQVGEVPLSFEKACPELKIPGPVEKIVFKCMAKRPEDRYESMDQLKLDLNRFLDGKRPRAMNMSISTVFAKEKLPDEPVIDDEKPLKIALLVILFLLMGLVTYAIWKGPERKDPGEVALGKKFTESKTKRVISPLAMLKQADELRILHHEDEARALYRNAIARAEERADGSNSIDNEVLAMAHYGLAGLYSHISDWKEAEKEIRASMYVQNLSDGSLAPGKERLQLELSDLLMKQGKLNESKQILQGLVKDSSDLLIKARAHMQMADIATVTGKLTEAQVNQLAAMSLLKDSKGLARKYYCLVLSRYVDALLVQSDLAKCDKVLNDSLSTTSPGDWDENDIDAAIYLTCLKARVLCAEKKYTAALDSCNSLIASLKAENFPSLNFKNFEVLSDDLIDAAAVTKVLSDKTDAAIEDIKDNPALNGNRFGHVATLARILIYKNQIAQAQDLISKYKKQALKRPSLKAEFYALQALALLQEKKYDAGLEMIDIALESLRKTDDMALHYYCLMLKAQALTGVNRKDAAALIEKSISQQNMNSSGFDFMLPAYQYSAEL